MTTPTTERPSGLWLADGVELLGEYQGSGLTEAPYLIRRSDGHTVQVSRLVYLVAEALTTHHLPEEIAEAVTAASGREVSVENVLYLVETKLGPVGLVPANEPGEVTPITANPLLALRLRLPLVPERAHRILSTALTPLFWPPVVAAVLATFAAADIWLFTSQGSKLVEGLQTVINEPHLLLVLTGLTLAAGGFHELGHAAAARYGGARPGAMGAGIYIVWPVFYTDVSDTYRLDRRGRLRTDLGGVYFNLISAIVAATLFATTGYGPLLILAVLLQFETLRQFLPFVRLDGYYVMSDLAGVPNLFAYMSPVLTVLLRRGGTEALDSARHKLGELTTKARVLITCWVLVTAPVLVINVVLFLVVLPRLAGTAWGSAGQQIEAVVNPTGGISPAGVANGVIGITLLALPVLGMAYLLGMLLNRAAHFAASKWAERPALTGAASGTAVAALVLHVGLAWPSGFVSALSDARDTPGTAGADPLGVALGSDLPAGLTGLAPTPPAATPVSTSSDDDTDDDSGRSDSSGRSRSASAGSTSYSSSTDQASKPADQTGDQPLEPAPTAEATEATERGTEPAGDQASTSETSHPATTASPPASGPTDGAPTTTATTAPSATTTADSGSPTAPYSASTESPSATPEQPTEPGGYGGALGSLFDLLGPSSR